MEVKVVLVPFDESADGGPQSEMSKFIRAFRPPPGWASACGVASHAWGAIADEAMENAHANGITVEMCRAAFDRIGGEAAHPSHPLASRTGYTFVYVAFLLWRA